MTLTIVNGRDRAANPLDVRIDGGRISALGPSLGASLGDVGDVIDVEGGLILPGLHDHHVHIRSMAAHAASVDVGPPADHTAMASRLAGGLGADATWVRGVGYHESVAGPLDRHRLDEMVADRPVRVQHRSGVIWFLNSSALDRVGAAGGDHPGIQRGPGGEPTGVLVRADEWLDARTPPVPLQWGSVGRAAARLGVTGFTDTDPTRTPAELATLIEQHHAGELPQRLHLMCPPGVELDHFETITMGPAKLMLDDDLLPGIDEVVDLAARAHDEGRGLAVHVVTRTQLMLTLAAFTEAGTAGGDRIEHGSVIPPEAIPRLARLGLVVVTQPNFVSERGDAYRRDVDGDDQPDLYRCRSLLEGRVRLAAGTDAPFGQADPWAAIRAACRRTTSDGEVLGPDETVSGDTALDLFLGSAHRPDVPRRLRAGDAADVCVVDWPLGELAPDDPDPVRLSVIRGEVAFVR
ncbi:MAG TPA: amidohydrolase family protein [Acidimicrobiales bacterium]|jgi:predicted amidohydrolase YtcJ